MKPVVILLIVLLVILHQDFWWWDDRTLLFGFLPLGLAWQAVISLAAGLVWWLAVLYCWPRHLDQDEPNAIDAAQEKRPDRSLTLHKDQ